MITAITRALSPSFAHCELTHIERVPIDMSRAYAQHRAYEEALERLGVAVVALPAEPDLPDSVFVEDTAIVLPERAIITCPGAASRRPEVPSIAQALAHYRNVAWIHAPATIDGGDVLVVGKNIYVGQSTRSNAAGMEALAHLVTPYGYHVRAVPLSGCLHLKSAATLITEDTLLVNPAWVRPDEFAGLSIVSVNPDEPHGANALRVGDAVVYPTAFPRTRDQVARFVKKMECVDVSELAKAEGAVTCCSLLVPHV